MLSKSGIGWNDTEHMLDATNEAWEALLKVDIVFELCDTSVDHTIKTGVKYFFGTDRATGGLAESFSDAVQGVLNITEVVLNDVAVYIEEIFRPFEGDGESMSINHSTPSNTNTGTKMKSKKRKQTIEGDNKIVDAINKLADITKEQMSTFLKEMVVENNLVESQVTNYMDNVLVTLETITELTLDEKV